MNNRKNHSFPTFPSLHSYSMLPSSPFPTCPSSCSHHKALIKFPSPCSCPYAPIPTIKNWHSLSPELLLKIDQHKILKFSANRLPQKNHSCPHTPIPCFHLLQSPGTRFHASIPKLLQKQKTKSENRLPNQ